VITLNGKEYEARKFTLGNYPECMEAFQAFAASESVKEKRDALVGLLGAAFGISKEDAVAVEFDEAIAAVNALTEVNKLPKA